MALREYLQVLRWRWRWLAASLLLGLLCACALTWSDTPTYASNVSLYVNAPGTSGSLDQAYSGSLLAEQKAGSYPELIGSERIRADVSELLGSTVSPGSITALAEPGSVVLTATATDASPQRAADIANAVGATFSDFIFELERFPGAPRAPIEVDVIQAASVPTSPVSPVLEKNLAIGAVLGALVGLAAAFVRHSLDTSVQSAATLKELTDVPMLGVLTLDRSRRSRTLADDPPPSDAADPYRQLRTALQLLDPEQCCRVVAVTSARAGDGRSTVACNLAIVFGWAGIRVLVVDADIRQPRAATYLGVSASVGLTDIIRGTATADDALTPSRSGVDVLASGPVPADASELLAAPGMTDLMKELRERYDLVLVDTPPLAAAETAVIAARCDAAVLVVRSASTTRDQVLTAVDQLQASSTLLLGTVLTTAPALDLRSLLTALGGRSRTAAPKPPAGLDAVGSMNADETEVPIDADAGATTDSMDPTTDLAVRVPAEPPSPSESGVPGSAASTRPSPWPRRELTARESANGFAVATERRTSRRSAAANRNGSAVGTASDD